MISYLEALEIIFATLPAPQKQKRKLVEADGYFLAEDIISPLDLPEFDNSAMDGYALRSHDTHTTTEANPVQLRVVGEALAGHTFNSKVGKNCAVYIATGAGIPVGTDAVIPVEEIQRAGSEAIGVASPVKKYNHIRFRGEELRRGTTVFARGEMITPAHAGLLATFGIPEVKVYKKPQISFLATGDELVTPDKMTGPGQIRNSNSFIIRALAEQLGCTFNDLGIARDSEQDILNKLNFDHRPDILITSAGVSAGEYDLVIESLKKKGLVVKFWRVAVKPGKPVVLGMLGDIMFFGLPGNPVSAAVTFAQFVEPAVLAIAGSRYPLRSLFTAVAQDGFKRAKGRLHFARGIASYDKELFVRSAGKQGSHMLSSLARSNCYVLVPKDTEVKEGDKVYIQLHGVSYDTLDTIREAFALSGL